MRALVLAALAAGLAAAPSSLAATRCVGEQTTAYVCVTTPPVGTDEETYCVYTGGSSCTEVSVPVPDASGNVDVTCGGSVKLLQFVCG